MKKLSNTEAELKISVAYKKKACNPILREKCPHLEFSWSVFLRIWTKYENIRSIYPYSVQMRENTDQKNFEYGHFSSSVYLTWVFEVLLDLHE